LGEGVEFGGAIPFVVRVEVHPEWEKEQRD
jgi:hypothetical protein